MKLYLVRHGPAEDQAQSQRDGDRALTSSGRARVHAVAQTLVHAGEAPRLIVTSPLVRCIQTAQILALAVDPSGAIDVEVRREMAPGGQVASLARKLAMAGRKRVMLVGHEPDMSAGAHALLGSFEVAFEKAMVVGIHLGKTPEAKQTRLRFILDPKTLELRAPSSAV